MKRVAACIRRESSAPPFELKTRSKKEALIGIIYFIGPDEGMVKIGFTNDLQTRLKRLQCGSPVPLKVLASISGQPQTLEREYHTRFASARQHGEWFLRTIAVNAEIERLNLIPHLQEHR